MIKLNRNDGEEFGILNESEETCSLVRERRIRENQVVREYSNGKVVLFTDKDETIMDLTPLGMIRLEDLNLEAKFSSSIINAINKNKNRGFKKSDTKTLLNIVDVLYDLEGELRRVRSFGPKSVEAFSEKIEEISPLYAKFFKNEEITMNEYENIRVNSIDIVPSTYKAIISELEQMSNATLDENLKILDAYKEEAIDSLDVPQLTLVDKIGTAVEYEIKHIRDPENQGLMSCQELMQEYDKAETPEEKSEILLRLEITYELTTEQESKQEINTEIFVTSVQEF